MAATYGFRFQYYLNDPGSTRPILETLVFLNTEVLTKGDIVNLETGEVDLAATGDTALYGVANETVSGTDSTTEIEIINGHNAVFAVTDANARYVGETLAISGTTGAMTVAAPGNSDLLVIKKCTASEPTLVIFHPATDFVHALT